MTSKRPISRTVSTAPDPAPADPSVLLPLLSRREDEKMQFAAGVIGAVLTTSLKGLIADFEFKHDAFFIGGDQPGIGITITDGIDLAVCVVLDAQTAIVTVNHDQQTPYRNAAQVQQLIKDAIDAYLDSSQVS
jgi:hypothetical protein